MAGGLAIRCQWPYSWGVADFCMKPLIAITIDSAEQERILTVSANCPDRIVEAGGLPLLVPHTEERDFADELVDRIDGLFLTGGGDPAPLLMGEDPRPGNGRVTWRRDLLELRLTRAALAKDLPILGICRGLQLLNVAAGGTIWQDLAETEGHTLQHRQTHASDYPCHWVELQPGSKLCRWMDLAKCSVPAEAGVAGNRLAVNSTHHQAIRLVAQGFRVSAKAADGVIEGIESETHPFQAGVQWHPEKLRDPGQRHLFKSFVEACAKA